MGSKFSKEQIEKAVNFCNDGGMSQREACDALGYPSQSTLSRWIRADARYASCEEDGLGNGPCGRRWLKVGAKNNSVFPCWLIAITVATANEVA